MAGREDYVDGHDVDESRPGAVADALGENDASNVREGNGCGAALARTAWRGVNRCGAMTFRAKIGCRARRTCCALTLFKAKTPASATWREASTRRASYQLTRYGAAEIAPKVWPTGLQGLLLRPQKGVGHAVWCANYGSERRMARDADIGCVKSRRQPSRRETGHSGAGVLRYQRNRRLLIVGEDYRDAKMRRLREKACSRR